MPRKYCVVRYKKQRKIKPAKKKPQTEPAKKKPQTEYDGIKLYTRVNVQLVYSDSCPSVYDWRV